MGCRIETMLSITHYTVIQISDSTEEAFNTIGGCKIVCMNEP